MADRPSAPRSSSHPPGPDPLIGRVIDDRFKVVALMARGGMGKVYRAEQSPLGRVCALKVLNPNYSGEHDPEFHKRFFLEASIASKLTHPNTVTIFDYGRTSDDVYYMAMEYLEGVTLHRAIRQAGTISEERAAHVARQICRALREAHTLGVIHRDLKPANIFLTTHGDEADFVKVLDFGLVKSIAGDTKPEDQLTQTGLFMGSPKYMAPEQIRGELVDGRTDIYSLGIVLYECLAGKVPFERPTSLGILMAQVNDEPPPLRTSNPQAVVSPLMEDIIARCLAKDPNKRYPSMNDVLLALKRIGAPGMAGLEASGEHRVVPAIVDSLFPPAAISEPPPQAPPERVPFPSASPGPTPSPMSGNLPLAVPPGVDLHGDSAVADRVPRRSGRRGAVVGVLASVVAAVIAVYALRSTGRPGPTAFPDPETSASAQVAARPAVTPSVEPPATAPVVVPSASAPVAPEEPRALRLTTDPPGAVVKEEGREVCSATPCEARWAADAPPQHTLSFFKPGYRLEMRVVHADDASLLVRFARVSVSSSPRPPPSAATPSGFKEIPY